MSHPATASVLHAIVPIKNLTDVKTRLGNILSADERRLLVEAMAEDVVTALKKTKGLSGVSVITHDTRVEEWARANSLGLIDDTSSNDLSSAISLAAARLRSEGASAVLVVLADTPFAKFQEFREMIGIHNELHKRDTPHMLIAPSREDGGTNALIISPPDGMALHYGKDSGRAHGEEAERMGLATMTFIMPGIGHDIDTEIDLVDAVQQLKRLPRHSKTKQFLTTSGIAARLAQKSL